MKSIRKYLLMIVFLILSLREIFALLHLEGANEIRILFLIVDGLLLFIYAVTATGLLLKISGSIAFLMMFFAGIFKYLHLAGANEMLFLSLMVFVPLFIIIDVIKLKTV